MAMAEVLITMLLVIAAYAAYPYLQNMIYRKSKK
jgi:Tfp pilus assembly protein PilV